ncbi:hydrogenase accessory protein HypB [Oscillochloris trichoides DG-6]|uniref:Hydrogenase accessory protein HypB n=1 Tax=Oscillochloris trichoides DG-6 TaxID=765420 RepID=E1IH08_9CHLR|nr:hydrogenase nickel incorporation protein HypB [Oscillochloris trichoides]EFO79483.1 hydrogenase accessory protein HypB [Oscillochloris trichoides DG-6]
MSESPRLVEVRQNVLSKNDQLALELRQRFDQAGVRVINLLSSPGAGKTRLLEETLRQLSTQHRVAALVGDLATDNDARRLARSGAAVRQIETGGLCHLEADLVLHHLEGWNLADFDFLFIENVGNLVCPTSYDLGEHGRVVLMAVTEGEDKPLKYPGTFQWANMVLLSKLDMAEVAEFDADSAHANIAAVHPGVPVIATSARTGVGMAEWLAWVEDL